MITNTSLVIGANSFLGSHLIKTLYDQSESVEGVYHVKKDRLHTKVTHHAVASLHNLPDTYRTVYLVSACIPEDMNIVYSEAIHNVNVHLVQKVCSYFKRAKIVFVSSVSVYDPSTLILNESSSLQFNTGYAISKIWAETIVKNHKNFAIVRFSSLYGEGMKLTTFLPNIIKSAITNKRITLYGDGSRAQNYLHVLDAVSYLIASGKQLTSNLYLGVASTSVSNLEAAKQVALFFDNISIQFEGKDISPSYIYNNNKTVQSLNIEQTVPFKKGIASLVTWIKKQY
ncbi:NAD-dependent epimerase/dehydratase family protein [Patiriisocius hiemis]|uniref:NAD(P)-dependent oxidoreductase n=1 Tax=Patiriisocius hiemis TaxID=3075604 RepID=A0ABU2YFP6_9FLAO|nr:NAD(P)-dependent oxidoreductase [Constantimarinum sp. W242]MDT0556045.1 NAD(P)-dependent oxidoreductase [Constantimarinum sp. W242]